MSTTSQIRRVGRVARGVLHADTRFAYRQRARQLIRRSAPRTCRVCGSGELKRQRQTFYKDHDRSFVVEICGHCGFVANPANFNDYTSYESVTQFPSSARVGTEAEPGREFYMAQLARDILRRDGLDVLIVGPGASVDFAHIGQLDHVRRVAIGDIVKLHDVEDFVDLSMGTRQRFDVVIASEVIEHFLHPAQDFPRLFRLLRRDGLAVCSTNVYDGSATLNRHHYLFIRGHTAYYTATALRRLAARSKMLVDFRVPKVAERLGPRKRYVLFAREAATMQDVAEYFGGHPYAPSEA